MVSESDFCNLLLKSYLIENISKKRSQILEKTGSFFGLQN